MDRAEHLKAHHFKKGYDPRRDNPQRIEKISQPRGTALRVRIQQLLRMRDPGDKNGQTHFDKVAMAYIMKMKQGSFLHFKELFDREEGKVPSRIAGADGSNLKLYIGMPDDNGRAMPPPEQAEEGETLEDLIGPEEQKGLPAPETLEEEIFEGEEVPRENQEADSNGEIIEQDTDSEEISDNNGQYGVYDTIEDLNTELSETEEMQVAYPEEESAEFVEDENA